MHIYVPFFSPIQIKLFPLLIKINIPPLFLSHVAEGSFSHDAFGYLIPGRNDKARRPWFRHRRPERRRGEGRLLEDGHAQHGPPTAREASLSHGRGVRPRACCLNLPSFLFQLSRLLLLLVLLLRRYAVDLVVCVALGCDMFDCVFPTRTAVSSPLHTHTNARTHAHAPFLKGHFMVMSTYPALISALFLIVGFLLLSSQRFGSALVPWGSLQVKQKQYAKDLQPIDPDCHCPTCKRYLVWLMSARCLGNNTAEACLKFSP